ncbi:hypothetical protein [Bradyrhizobium denitrificans]|uniref:hypothetical protein n=1 Tax=Bradyrhizobium denitrificans TaxID=2734912 RepID=UPI0015581ABE|nr:hypothetical protein [Bradyrhizobium sp. LMG 8443]NPU23980.1 hypothetical protein [Bradyrhizobium sp. LMG 8443]
MSTAAAAASPAPTHNQLGDDAVIAVNLGKIRDAKIKVDAAGNNLRTVEKNAEGKGINLKAAKRALAIVKSGEADEWLEETSATTRYLKILRHGVTDNQLDLAFESTLAPIEEKAALDGRAMGLDTSSDAIEEKNPHALNTRAGQAWLTAFRQGRRERDIILSMKDDIGEDDEANGSADEGDEED